MASPRAVRSASAILGSIIMCCGAVTARGEEKTRPSDAPPRYLDKVADMPDLCQADPVLLPDGEGSQWCGPAATANAILWLARHGHPHLVEGDPSARAVQAAVIRELASPACMATEKGTALSQVVAGIEAYFAAHGAQATVETMGWRSPARRIGRVPDVDWMLRALHGDSNLVLNIGWYRYDARTRTYSRHEGHYVTAVGYVRSAKDVELYIHDPSSRDGVEPRTVRCPLRPLVGGATLQVEDGGTIASDGFHALRGLRVRKSGDVAVIDFAIAFQPAPSDARPAGAAPAAALVRGQPVQLRHEHGDYYRYVPADEPGGVLVIVHGQLAEGDPATGAAETYIQRWTRFADEHRLVVISPAFDQENFGGHAGPGGGYRGLFGRHVGADVFVNALVDEARKSFPNMPEQFYLYGHSAGGQFVSRYLVVHPSRVTAAVISAAASFAFPDPLATWANGMGTLKRRMRWSDDEPWKEIEITPDVTGWLAAAQIPVTVVVGERDTEELKASAGNPGRNHVERARHWVEAMRALAGAQKKNPATELIVVPDVGHNSRALTPASQKALAGALAASRPESR